LEQPQFDLLRSFFCGYCTPTRTGIRRRIGVRQQWPKKRVNQREVVGTSVISTEDPLLRSKDLVMDKMIRVIELLEKRTRELGESLNAAEVKITQLTAKKSLGESANRKQKKIA
jgi:hypothetical protein